MDNILNKFAAQDKKKKRIMDRDKNKLCSICGKTMRQNGFSSIPKICRVCEQNEVHK